MKNLLAALLILSIAVGVLMLLFDGLLWFDNPKNGHAYSLVVFTLIQLFLLAGVFAGRAGATKAVASWAAAYLAMLLLNPLTGPAIGISPTEFAMYLFGLTPVSSFDGVSCPFLCPPFAVSYTVLVVLQAILLYVGVRAVRR
ncbi:MAG: hypothetical protein NZ570_01190 [Candidatus Caldarchaeum sp.]|nr:hypothetical protein [Candidatus Caldarchaeum sp.]MCS7137059.1 hypothetical protein [Candidatus Caldarchaeum sp.]MDW8359452.1 hypothetical protein [Candidatus Caldarchaeum sp.]